MEDQENNQENEQQGLGHQIAESGKQQIEQIAKDEAKKIAKQAGKAAGKAALHAIGAIMPFITPVILVLVAVVVIFGGLYALIDKVREIVSTNPSSNSSSISGSAEFITDYDEMVNSINDELKKSGIDKSALYLGDDSTADKYIKKFIKVSLSTQLPKMDGEDVDGIVKIKRKTGENTKELKYKKYEDFIALINEKDTSVVDYFSLNKDWMLCIAKYSKTTTTNTDGTKTVENKLEEVKIPYQTMISQYTVPLEFFIALQQTSQNAEYVSAVADLIKGGEIELTIFDYSQVITTEHTYNYKIRKRWTEEQVIQKDNYTNTVSSRSFTRTTSSITNDITNIRLLATTGQIFNSNSFLNIRNSITNYLRNKGCNVNINVASNSKTSVVWQNNNIKYTASIETKQINPNQWSGQVTITDTIIQNPTQPEETVPEDSEELENPEEQEQEPEIIKVQKDETGELQSETTIIVQETNSITANITKANVWIIDQETTYQKNNITEYPLGEEGITNELEPEKSDEEIEKIPEGSWKVERSETTKKTVEKEEWQIKTSKTEIDEGKFLKLWKKNESGKYSSNGDLVKYKRIDRAFDSYESPVGNILSSEDLLYNQLERSENTQNIAILMRYLIQYYKDPTTAKEPDLNLFNTREFTEVNWNKYGSGYWWPLQDTTQTRITSTFGYRGDIGVEGATANHKGIDIGVPTGSEVIASADGTVEVAGFNISAGNWIRINHDNGIKTVYMHNSVLIVTVGQEVKQGDVIALSGNTGASSGPHLHFGVSLNGEYVDPLEYVSVENPRPTNSAPDVPSDVEAWNPYIVQAFEELGYQCTDEKIAAISRQIQTESNGNQYVIQGIKDSNSGKSINIGDGTCPWCASPSGESCENTNIGHGLLQFIPTTFYANMVAGHTNIFNGYDQICACITMLERRTGEYTDYIGKGTGWG